MSMIRLLFIAILFSCTCSYGQENTYVYYDTNNVYCEMKYDTFFSKSAKPIYIRCVLTYHYISKEPVERLKDGAIRVYSKGLYPIEFFYCVSLDSSVLKIEFPELFEENYRQPEKNFVKIKKKHLRSKKIFDFNIMGSSITAFRDFEKKASENHIYIIFRHQKNMYLQKARYIIPNRL